MFCDKCGNQLREGAKFCPKCGHSAVKEEIIKTMPYPVAQKTSKKRSKWTIVAAAASIVLIVVAIIAWSYFGTPSTVQVANDLSGGNGYIVRKDTVTEVMFTEPPELRSLQRISDGEYLICYSYEFSCVYGTFLTIGGENTGDFSAGITIRYEKQAGKWKYKDFLIVPGNFEWPRTNNEYERFIGVISNDRNATLPGESTVHDEIDKTEYFLSLSSECDDLFAETEILISHAGGDGSIEAILEDSEFLSIFEQFDSNRNKIGELFDSFPRTASEVKALSESDLDEGISLMEDIIDSMNAVVSFLETYDFTLAPLDDSDTPVAPTDFPENEYGGMVDYANVFSDETKKLIHDVNNELKSQCKDAQFVIVTVETLGDISSEEYAHKIYSDWGIGNTMENNNTLMLLSPFESRGWFISGAGNDGLTSDRIDDMLDNYFWTYVDNGEYDKAIENLIISLLAWYDGYYGSNVSSLVAN